MLAATIRCSAIASIDATVVGIKLPRPLQPGLTDNLIDATASPAHRVAKPRRVGVLEQVGHPGRWVVGIDWHIRGPGLEHRKQRDDRVGSPGEDQRDPGSCPVQIPAGRRERIRSAMAW